VRLICYPTTTVEPELRPAPQARQWMDELPESFAYRCLPLVIANMHGWEILSPCAFTATWNGGRSKNDITISDLDGEEMQPTTHFGSGVLTFHTGYLVRTEPGYNLWVQGPVNRPKDGIHALTGIIETDWSPYTFTMNWLFTRPNHPVRFEKGEPFCAFYPMPRGMTESFQPEIRSMDEEPDTREQFEAWSQARRTFNLDLLEPESDARKNKWQKDYYRGYRPDGREGLAEHQTKVRPRPFKDKR